MKKENTLRRNMFIKTMYIMKLPSILLLVISLHLSVFAYSQGITLKEENAPLEKIFQEIKKQSNYLFWYENRVLKLANTVSIDVKNADIKKVLNLCFKNQPLTYKIVGNTVVITKKSSSKGDEKDEKNVNVRGRVVDESGNTLLGATVLIKGTTKGTTTDPNGNYAVRAFEGSVLVFSFIGFQTQEVPVFESTEINVVMRQKTAELGEVVIKPINTGYQLIKPEQSTGSVSQISTKEFESQISDDFLSGLASRVPGLMINDDVTFTSTVDGETTKRSLFNIRGISTISGNQNPLIVVDGFPTELTLDMIDPYEIESISILKDAAATTVYGVRASNGVIVIERKKAKVGKPKVFFRTTLGFTPKEKYSRYDYAPNASELAINYIRDINPSIDPTTYNQFFAANGKSSHDPVYYVLAQQAGNIITLDQAEEAFAAMGSYDNTKDYERLFLRTAVTQNYNLDVSGGTSNALYYLSLKYTGNQESEINNENNLIQLSARIRLNFSKRFSLNLQTNYMESNTKRAPVPSVDDAYRFEPYEDELGTPLPITNGSVINPYYNSYIMSQGLEDHLYYPLIDVHHISDKTHTINNSFTADFRYNIGHGLRLSFGGIYESSHSDIRHYADEQSSEVRQRINNFITLNNDGTLNYNIPLGAYLQETTSSTSTYTLRSQLDYNTNIGEDHSINAILGGEIRGVVNKGTTSSYFGYNDQTLIQQTVDYTTLGAGIASAFMETSSLAYPFKKIHQEDRYVSAYSNIVYSFRNTYSLTASFRIDQSNLFGTNPKYRYKPLWSIGAAWNMHKENFLKDVSWIHELKLRVAYGFNGNVVKNSLPEVIAQNYLNQQTNPASNALSLYSMANSTLRWEETRNFNIGLNYGFNEHINLAFDFYTKNSKDVLSDSEIDPTYGAKTSVTNVATINNKGFEINLKADWIRTSKLNWNTGLVLSRNTSKVLDVSQSASSKSIAATANSSGYLPGYPVGALFAYRYGGLSETGYPIVVDTQGEEYSSDVYWTFDLRDIMYYAGSSIPTVNVGLSNRIDIGNFYFFCLMSYYGGFKVLKPAVYPGDPVTGSDNYWREPGDEQNTDIMRLEAFTENIPSRLYAYLDKNVVNGDYITLKTITASYSFNATNNKFLKKAGITHFEVKLQASNLFTVGLNKENYSLATGSYYKSFLTPTYTVGLLINF